MHIKNLLIFFLINSLIFQLSMLNSMESKKGTEPDKAIECELPTIESLLELLRKYVSGEELLATNKKKIKKLIKQIIARTGEPPQEHYFDPLIFAIYFQDIDFFRYLIDHRANPYFKGDSEMNAFEYLDMMIKFGRGDSVKLNELKGVLELYVQKLGEK